MNDGQPVLACDLGALSEKERARRSIIARSVSARFREVRETSDGYAARLYAEPQLVQDALDCLLLELCCCPFLRLELFFLPSVRTILLRLSGGLGGTGFIGEEGLPPSASP